MEEKDEFTGFVLINGNTWQPKHLYIARKKQREKTARQAETGIWMGNKPSVQVG